MLHQFIFDIAAVSLTNAQGDAIQRRSAGGTASAAGALPGLFTPDLVTGTDPLMTAWLSIPGTSAADFVASAAPAPASLRLWRQGTNTGTLVRPIYQLG